MPGGARWLVDLSNVMGARPDGWWRDRDGAQARLVAELATWRAQVGEPVTAVLDGMPSARVPEGTTDGVEVRYAWSRARNAADDVIVELVRTDAAVGELVVVTSDRALRDRVTVAGARVEGARRFLDRLAEARG